MLGQNFPISDFLRDRIVDGETLNRHGGWWSALLMLENPDSGKKSLALYRWQSVGGAWKNRSKFYIHSKEDALKISMLLSKWNAKL